MYLCLTISPPLTLYLSLWRAFWGRRMCVFAKRELFEKNAFITWFIRAGGRALRAGAKDELAAVNTARAQCRAARAACIPGGHALEGRATGTVKSGAVGGMRALAGVDMVPSAGFFTTRRTVKCMFSAVRGCARQAYPRWRNWRWAKNAIWPTRRENKQRLIAAWTALYEENRFR